MGIESVQQERQEAAPPALDADEFRRIGRLAVDLVAGYLADIRDQPVVQPMSESGRRTVAPAKFPEHGAAPEELLAHFERHVLPFPMGNGHPRFFGWVNSPPSHMGIIAEFLAAAQNPSCDVGDLASIHLETAVTRWLADLVGFPADTGGILVSGGSAATLTCLAAARQHVAERVGWDLRRDGLQDPSRPRLRLYASAEVHSSLRKSVELLGLGHSAVRTVAVDADRRLDSDDLDRAVREDLARGDLPFCVVATAGTVNTGAVDRLDTLADVCARHSLWLHVDGAYGAAAAVLPELGEVYRGLERADSVSLDPHKWLSVPIETGCALVRDAALMRRTFSHVPPYLMTEQDVGIGGALDYAEYGFQQTRGFRALKTWMTLQHMGRDGLRTLVRRHLGLARRLEAMIDAADDLWRMSASPLSVVCFRYAPPGGPHTAEDLDRINRRIVADVQTDGRVFLTGTVLDGTYVLRACVLHHSTEEDDVAALVSVVREIGREIAGKAGHA
ncbi:pyridoxal-dependent decarboxylase [Streptomyces sp. NPDC002088]|uniref:pyridoxal phosphate-dependent decarboxylase family protein n=1 Tax=Streptomyces sp. NPDC002088 TaxID=3154665 RepID=UPI003318D4A4